MEKSITEGLLQFIDHSPSVFHAVENVKNELLDSGFVQLFEGERWELSPGGSYFVTRNGSAVIGFKLPKGENMGFNMVAAHSDSPTFKIKENAEITVKDRYLCLNTEGYGGMIMSTWFDKPLSVAGRVILKKEGKYIQRLVNVDRDLLIIPSLAIHMDRGVNDGKKLNPQTDLMPILGSGAEKGGFLKLVGEAAGCDPSDIMGMDLSLYNRQRGCVFGLKNEYIGAPKLDDLQCVYGALQGLKQGAPTTKAAVLGVFDNEEVGSATKQGAGSTFLYDTLTRVNNSLGYTSEYYLQSVANSFMISADNAHAVHPNNVALADPTNQPYINNGIVIKYSANQKYTTDGLSAAMFKGLIKACGLEYQSFANRSDMPGGSTLGNISATKVAANTVDIGLPQLAMHSSFETAGTRDTEDFVKVCSVHFSE
ncbi:MAG: M18 family aminopeptidase [Oscillospiraceae bacterium]